MVAGRVGFGRFLDLVEVAWPEGSARPQAEGDGDRGQLARVRDTLRSGVLLQPRHGAQRHHLPGVRFEIDHLQPVGVLLKLRQHFEQYLVLVGGGIDGGGILRAEGVVERRGNLVPVQVQGGGAVAIEDDVDLRVLDLQVAVDFQQSRQAGDNALQFGGFRVKLLGVRPIQRVIVAALGHAAAHANGLGNRQVDAQSGDVGNLGAKPVHDVVHGGHTLPARFQVDHQPAGVGGSAKAAAGTGVETLDVRVLHDDLRPTAFGIVTIW